ncbi:MAG: hypothetical protein WBA17_07210 [Saprospiraceae bacterium]
MDTIKLDTIEDQSKYIENLKKEIEIIPVDKMEKLINSWEDVSKFKKDKKLSEVVCYVLPLCYSIDRETILKLDMQFAIELFSIAVKKIISLNESTNTLLELQSSMDNINTTME